MESGITQLLRGEEIEQVILERRLSFIRIQVRPLPEWEIRLGNPGEIRGEIRDVVDILLIHRLLRIIIDTHPASA